MGRTARNLCPIDSETCTRGCCVQSLRLPAVRSLLQFVSIGASHTSWISFENVSCSPPLLLLRVPLRQAVWENCFRYSLGALHRPSRNYFSRTIPQSTSVFYLFTSRVSAGDLDIMHAQLDDREVNCRCLSPSQTERPQKQRCMFV